LKENVILGHLIPAGTGFKSIHDSEVRIQPAALEALASEKERVLERSFPLLESALRTAGSDGNGERTPPPERQPAPSGLDALLGEGGQESSSDLPAED
jgi:DNA-directed RNA polymerase subunit beta'